MTRKYRDDSRYSENLTLLLLHMSIADEVIRLRAIYGLRTTDAIQPGTALTADADYVLANERKWIQVEEIEIIQIGGL